MTLLPFGGRSPTIAPTAFVAPGTRVIGAVTIGDEASIWYNCVLRGDVDAITVGARTNIQDGSVIHVTTRRYATDIGADCLIGHLAILHGCRLHDRSFVGLGAIVMDGCEIESEAMLAAGGMLTPGKRIPSGQMWAGRPARYFRDLSADDLEAQRAGVASYVALGRAHRAALAEAAQLTGMAAARSA